MGKKDFNCMSQRDTDKIKDIYAYKPNSNLVLQHDKSLQDQRPSNEATGELQSLAGKITGRMGDRINTSSSSRPIKPDDKEMKRRKKDESSKLKHDLNDPRNYSVADIETKDLFYQPKSESTAEVYGLILKFVRKQLGFLHNNIINGAADEVIETMKDPELNEEAKKSLVEVLLSPQQPIDDSDYNELCNLCKKINDWDSHQSRIKDDMEPTEEESGEVGVIFDDEDDVDSDDYLAEVRDSDDEAIDEMLFKAEETAELTTFAPMEEDTLDSKYKSIDLEDLSKRQSVNPRIELSEPIRKEGYQEYHIEPKKPRRHNAMRKIRDLPENESYYVQKAFGEGIESLNLIQGMIYERAIRSDESLLICAPTGAGKTNIAVLTMLREILKHPKDSGFDVDKFKIIYVAPIKALVQEIVENFKQKFSKSPFNLKVEELTGDRQLSQSRISETQIIVCTPEKWDILTRKSQDRLYTKLVKLVIFDEIHLLHNERGATLEALVTRIKRHKQIEGQSIRIIGLSATLPNYADVARFIAPGQSEVSSTLYFDSSFRPVPLRQQYIAMMETKKAFKINDIVYEKVIERLKAQILIFVHSRPETAKTADYIKDKAIKEDKIGRFLSSESALEQINVDGKRLGSKLKELLQFGIGIHHAGLTVQERSCVEDLFRRKCIKVLVSTATLAWGVNLPARTVIIKGTEVYRDGRWTNLDSLDVTQMLGRAGRPGFDTEGEGIVITQQSQVSFYMSLMTEQLPVESKLISRLPEFVNAECVIGSIECLDDTVNWLSETYLNSRMMSVVQQPENKQYLSLYGIHQDAKNNDPKLTSHKSNLAYTAACILDDRGLIVFDRHSGAMKSTDLGRIASHYNCSSRTIKLFHDSIREHTSDIELFRTFSLADEFKDIFVRRGEELDLQTLLNQVPFPIDDKCATPGANKVNALLQVYIFRLNIEGSDLISDMHFIRENAARLARAINEIVLMKGYALVAELSLDLCRKIDKRMTVCHSPLRQFSDDIDLDIINRLEKKNYHIDELRLLKEDKITEMLRCDRRQGEKVYKFLKYLPKVAIEASIKPICKSSLEIELTIRPDFSWNSKYHGNSERFCLLVEDVNQEVLLHHEMIHIKKYNLSEKIRTVFTVPYLTPIHPFYFIRLFPDGWFGCDQHLPIYMEKLNMPDESTVYTPLLDLELRTIRSLENDLFERALEKKLGGTKTSEVVSFNEIQTQAFQHLYSKDDDVILLAAAGSGKTTCAELAIIRNINLRGKASKSAYISANIQSAELVYKNWLEFFGQEKLLGQDSVILLTGNYRADAAKISKDSTNIVIGDPHSWHVLTLTRYKKYRKLLNKFQLYVMDDIHLLHSDKDSILEWVCSRIRYITKTDGGTRVVALGSPVACADSLKSWLAFERGSKEPILLNYSPDIRPVKLELTIQRFHHYDYRMRMMTMLRPVYRYITHDARSKPALVFVADYLQAQEVCESITTYAKSEGRIFGSSVANLHKIHDEKLKEYLQQGVGYLYCGMHNDDRQAVETSYLKEQIQVIVATTAMCWSMQCRPYLTVIMDTQHFNGIETIDYALTDILQMIGLTGRPLEDHGCKCIVLCQSSKADSYDRFLRNPLPVESDLPANLISHVNYEIATGSLTELNSIYKPYLAHTFFYKRITINPNYYGIILPEDYEQKSQVFTTFFNNLVNKVALELEETDFINMEGSHENPTFSPGLLSQISLGHHINYETLVSYTRSLALDSRSLDLIELIAAHTFEFKQIPIRHGDLVVLKTLQRRYKTRDTDQAHTNASKIKLLILSQYQNLAGKDNQDDQLEGELIEDRRFIIRMSHRLLMAIVDIAYIKDSFSLLKTAIQLSKRLLPFYRDSQPNLDMEVDIVNDGDQVTIEIIVKREDEQFSMKEFEHSCELPANMYRDEGWCFLVHGLPVSKSNGEEKLLLFERIKTPSKGSNEYKLKLTLPDNAKSCTYDLYLMSDFYPVGQDRKVPNINIHGITSES